LAVVVLLTIAVASAVGGAQRSGDSRDTPVLPKSSGLLTLGRDGSLRMASAARLHHDAGFIDKLGSLVVGLGFQAPGFDSAALSLVHLTRRGTLDPAFGTNGSVVTPLLPIANHDSAAVTALLEDATGRSIVVGWRTQSTGLDASVPVIVAARYTGAGALDSSFGERGIVTTRIERDYATQAFAATLDGDGRLLVAGYNGGRKSARPGAFDDWPIRVILLRYTASGVLDTSFGAGGVASHILVPGGPGGQAGREFLLYDYGHTKTAAVILDRQGRSVVAAAAADGPVVLMRYTREGILDSSFGSAGTVQTPIGKRSGISALFWGIDGRLLAAGTSDDNGVLLRYSADGVLDATFGDRGIRKTPIGEGLRVSAAVQEADGHMLTAASGMNSVQLARYDRDGKPDPRFGSNGVISTAVDRTVATTAGLAIDDAGTPVVTVGAANGMFLLRYNRGGQVDKSFLAVPNAHP
jgi:uncharacterized delta-60 repeat protein